MNSKTWVETFPNYKVDLKILQLDESWKGFSDTELYKEEIEKINGYLSYCLEFTQGKVNIFPYPDLLYNAPNTTPLNTTKIVILGQDPYFNFEMVNGKVVPQAMGLSFSVFDGITIPPSLVNINKNLVKFKHKSKMPTSGDLTHWANQGVLLLNTTLTVQAKCPNGHEVYWKTITDAWIKYISDNTDKIVFMLWGAPSLKKLNLIDANKHKILMSSHPSPLSANNKLRQYGSFMDSDNFGEANIFLEANGKDKIKW